jgi:orotidine 5'-phosphate decarboxylase subfamily 2
MNFRKKLQEIVKENNSLLCVGLDIDSEKIPDFLFKSNDDPYFEFNKSIIDATKDIVCAYKLNMAFYEIFGADGFTLLEKTINYIPKNILIILDGKRNDIGNTAKKYAKAFFETFHADAATINPYLGKDGISPFLDYKEKCSFILCRTSNPSAGDFQDLNFANKPLFSIVATKIKEWNIFDNCGAVVGATYPNELKLIRKKLGDNVPLLIPGIGKQRGNIETTVKYGTNKKKEMAIINSSRGIIYAGDDEDFAESARDSAELLKNEINLHRQ